MPHTCRTCGAVARATGVDLDAITRHAHARRAYEVAAFGQHPVVFTYHGRSVADCAMAFAQSLRSTWHIAAYCVAPCLCGNAGSAWTACACTPRQIARYQASKTYQRVLTHAEMWVTLSDNATRKLHVEPVADIHARIAAGVPGTSSWDLTPEAAQLLGLARTQFCLSVQQETAITAVAATIQHMRADTDTRVQPVAVAEAVQYRMPVPLYDCTDPLPASGPSTTA